MHKTGVARSSPVRLRPDGLTIALRVTPRSARERIEGIEIRADGEPRLRVRVRAVPDQGKANKAVIALLAKAWAVPQSAFSIVSGETARDKILFIEGAGETLAATIGSWLEAHP